MSQPAPLQGKTAKIGNYELYHVDEGTGFPVLLIHGLAGDHSAWTPQINAWRGSYRVIAADTRGAGRSTQVEEAITLQDLADDYIGLLDHLGVEKCHLIGRSLGGAISQLITLKAPERVQSLTMLASGAKFDAMCCRILDTMREVLEWRQSWADHARHSSHFFVSCKFFNENPETMAAIERLIAGTDRKIPCYAAQIHAVKQHDVLDRLVEIKCPVMVMSGSEDLICSPTVQRWMVERMPHAEWVEFQGAAHFFLMEQPEKFMADLGAFLARHTPA